MKNLRKQLLLSHLTLVGLMVLLMVGAVANFYRLSLSIDHILRDNLRSVEAAQAMQESLERQDSAATFFLAGQVAKARLQYNTNWPIFNRGYDTEAHNITEPAEERVADDIGQWYSDQTRPERRIVRPTDLPYRAALEHLLYEGIRYPSLSPEEQRFFYFHRLEPDFLRLKNRIGDVRDLNEAAMRARDARAKKQAEHASWIGLAMTAGAWLLALLFSRRAINAALTPLLALAQGAQEIGSGHLDQRIELNRADEIGMLADAFNQMALKLREARRVEKQSLQRAQKMSDVALENLYDPVLVTDAGGHILHLNRAAEGLFGPAQRAAGRPVAQVVNDQRIAQAVERAVRQEHVSAEEGEASYIPLQAGDTQRIYRLRATPMRDDDDVLLGAALVLEDVTHLRELDRLKTEFIGVASHELRTPVTSLLLSSQLLQEGAAGPLTPGQEEIVGAQREDLQRLDSLMRDLLDMTRLEAGVTPPRFELVEPGELVDAARQSIVSRSAGKQIKLQSSVDADLPAVRADRAQINRVLLNLLNNAVRHTPPGGDIGIEARRSAEGVLFRVQDSGDGIPAEYLPRIFDRFVQVPGATRDGAGLGLSISQAIVRAHESEIKAKSEAGHGSTFAFTLAAAPAERMKNSAD